MGSGEERMAADVHSRGDTGCSVNVTVRAMRTGKSNGGMEAALTKTFEELCSRMRKKCVGGVAMGAYGICRGKTWSTAHACSLQTK
jgi:hypothetical protein